MDANAASLLTRWRKLYGDLGFPEHPDGTLFSESGIARHQIEKDAAALAAIRAAFSEYEAGLNPTLTLDRIAVALFPERYEATT